MITRYLSTPLKRYPVGLPGLVCGVSPEDASSPPGPWRPAKRVSHLAAHHAVLLQVAKDIQADRENVGDWKEFLENVPVNFIYIDAGDFKWTNCNMMEDTGANYELTYPTPTERIFTIQLTREELQGGKDTRKLAKEVSEAQCHSTAERLRGSSKRIRTAGATQTEHSHII
jgi:hypothetical protein